MDVFEPNATSGVQDLYARYAHCLDGRDFTTFGDLFAEDAVFTIGKNTHTGRAAIEEFARTGTTPGGAHIITNVSARVGDTGRCSAVAYYLLMRRTEDGGPWGIVGVGSYESVATLDGDTWRFAEHRILPR